MQAVMTLLPLPVCPASAKQPLFVAVAVLAPVPEWSGQVSHAADDIAFALKVSTAHAVMLDPWPV